MKILNYGSMNIDNVYSVEHMARPGETILATGRGVFCGGKGLNQSIAIAKAGGQVCHAGIVGEDGGMLLDALHAAKVDTACVRKAAGPSSHTVIQVDANGQNSIIVFGGENMRPTEADIDRMLEGFGPGDAVLCFAEELPLYDGCPALAYGSRSDVRTLSAGLFSALRELDRPDVRRIFARCPEGGGVAYAVGNRLKKAAAFRVIDPEVGA